MLLLDPEPSREAIKLRRPMVLPTTPVDEPAVFELIDDDDDDVYCVIAPVGHAPLLIEIESSAVSDSCTLALENSPPLVLVNIT